VRLANEAVPVSKGRALDSSIKIFKTTRQSTTCLVYKHSEERSTIKQERCGTRGTRERKSRPRTRRGETCPVKEGVRTEKDGAPERVRDEASKFRALRTARGIGTTLTPTITITNNASRVGCHDRRHRRANTRNPRDIEQQRLAAEQQYQQRHLASEQRQQNLLELARPTLSGHWGIATLALAAISVALALATWLEYKPEHLKSSL
jgi:hypothetical protein